MYSLWISTQQTTRRWSSCDL